MKPYLYRFLKLFSSKTSTTGTYKKQKWTIELEKDFEP